MEPITCPHLNCGYVWTPRKANPKRCPQCQNPLWRSPRPHKKKPVMIELSEVREHEPSKMEALAESGGPFVVAEIPDESMLAASRKRAEELLRRLATQ